MCTVVLEQGVASRGSMSLANRCNANTYLIFVNATHIMCSPIFRITYQLLTKLQGQMCAQGYLSWGSLQRVACLEQADVIQIPISLLVFPPI